MYVMKNFGAFSAFGRTYEFTLLVGRFALNIWFSAAHTIHRWPPLIVLQSLGDIQRGCYMTLVATWQVTKTSLLDMAHFFLVPHSILYHM